MSQLKKVTDLVIYVGIVVVIICMGVIIRKIDDHDKDKQWRQLSMQGDVHRLQEVTPVQSVIEPAVNSSTGNLGISVDTGHDSHWKVVAATGDAKHAISMSQEDCTTHGWPGCDDIITYMSSGSASRQVVFVVRFKLQKDDLVTFSGAFRSNCSQLAVYMATDHTGGSTNIAQTIQEGRKLDSMDNPGPSSQGPATSATALHYSLPLQAGVHFVALALTVGRPEEIAFWFEGVVSGTLAENIMTA